MVNSTVAIILSAGKNQISNIPMIKREITQLRKVGISSIAVVTGYEGDNVEKELVRRNVISIRNYQYETCQMLDSIKLGIQAFKEGYERLMVVLADTPFVMDETLETLLETEAKAVVPTYNGKEGHPIILDYETAQFVSEYTGTGGLKGAIQSRGFTKVEVDDPGILMEADSEIAYDRALQYEKQRLMATPVHPRVDVTLCRKKDFLDLETVEFLIAVDWLGSMSQACKEVKIAYSKAWNMLNEAETQLGYGLIERQSGGNAGGSSSLTQEGKDLVRKYLELKEEVEEAAKIAYSRLFTS